jgi:hypothetical protein
VAVDLLEDRLVRFTARGDVAAAVERLGRAEDLCFSPDGKRLAIAGFGAERMLVLDVAAEAGPDGAQVSLTGFVEIECRAFSRPHGVAWIDAFTLAVASREGPIAIVAVPDSAAGPRLEVEPLRLIGADGTELVRTPGSVAAVAVGMGLIELLVCNNFVDHVTRHLLDQRHDYEVIASDILLGEGLGLPDGIAQSRSSRWIAISNPDYRNVVLLRSMERPDRHRQPDGVLSGVEFPHGVKFAAGERSLLVADSGAPFVRIYSSETGDWSGERGPSGAIRVMSDAIFARGNLTPREGGPKGLDLTCDNAVMAICYEHQPLAFFDMRGLLPASGDVSSPGAANDEALLGVAYDEPSLRSGGAAERARAALVHSLTAARLRVAQETEALRRAGEYDRIALVESQAEMRKLLDSRSWKLTLPLRWANGHLIRLRGRRLQTGRGHD